jgi:hypothetical protein
MGDRDVGGIALLAALTGHSEQTMRRDGRALCAGLLELAHEATGLLRGYASDDPAVREAAYRRWAELDAMLPKAEPPGSEREAGLSQTNRERLRVGLSKIVETLQDIEQSVSAQASPTDRGASPEP